MAHGEKSLWRKIPLVKQVVETYQRRQDRFYSPGLRPASDWKAPQSTAVIYRDNGENNQ